MAQYPGGYGAPQQQAGGQPASTSFAPYSQYTGAPVQQQVTHSYSQTPAQQQQQPGMYGAPLAQQPYVGVQQQPGGGQVHVPAQQFQPQPQQPYGGVQQQQQQGGGQPQYAYAQQPPYPHAQSTSSTGPPGMQYEQFGQPGVAYGAVPPTQQYAQYALAPGQQQAQVLPPQHQQYVQYAPVAGQQPQQTLYAGTVPGQPQQQQIGAQVQYTVHPPSMQQQHMGHISSSTAVVQQTVEPVHTHVVYSQAEEPTVKVVHVVKSGKGGGGGGGGVKGMKEMKFNALCESIRSSSFSKDKIAALAAGLGPRARLSCAQAKRIVGLFPHDSDQINACVMMHPHVVDSAMFGEVISVLKFSSSRKKVQQQIQNASTPCGGGAGGGKGRGGGAGGCCGPAKVLSDEELRSVLSSVKKVPFSSDKVDAIKFALSGGRLITCKQAKQLIKALTHSSDQEKVAVLLYPSIANPQAFPAMLNDALTFSSSRNTVLKKLGL